MKITLSVFLMLSLLPGFSHAALASPRAQAPASQGNPVLEDGTPVKLRISQTVSSASAHVGDQVEFEVLEEVKVGNIVVIPKGGIAWGTVTVAQHKRRMGRAGKLEIVMDSVRLADGQKAALRATKEVKGKGRTGAMTAGIVATGLLLWPVAPFFLFMHGKDITIPKDTVVPTFVNGDFPIELARFEKQAPAGAQTALASAIAAVSEVTVTSKPSGADIEIDGNFVGNTPSTIRVPAGEHTINVAMQGWKPWERKIKLDGGRINVGATLAPATAPAGAGAPTP